MSNSSFIVMLCLSKHYWKQITTLFHGPHQLNFLYKDCNWVWIAIRKREESFKCRGDMVLKMPYCLFVLLDWVFQIQYLKRHQLCTGNGVMFVTVPEFFKFLLNVFQHQCCGRLLIIDLDIVCFQHNLHITAAILKHRLPALTHNPIHCDVIACEKHMTASWGKQTHDVTLRDVTIIISVEKSTNKQQANTVFKKWTAWTVQ